MTGSHEHLEDATRAQGVDRLESFCRSEMSAVGLPDGGVGSCMNSCELETARCSNQRVAIAQ